MKSSQVRSRKTNKVYTGNRTVIENRTQPSLLTNYAKVDTPVVIGNIFKPKPKMPHMITVRGTRVVPYKIVKCKHGDTLYEFSGPYSIGVKDLTLLLVILNLISDSGARKRLSSNPKRDGLSELRDKLEENDNARGLQTIYFHTTLYQLFSACHLETGKQAYRVMWDTLDRLSKISFTEDTPKKRFSSHLLSYSHDKETNDISIAVNYRLARLFISLDSIQFTRVDMDRYISLPDPVKYVYVRMCATVNHGDKIISDICKLYHIVYSSNEIDDKTGEEIKTEDPTPQQYRDFKAHLTSLRTIGWQVEFASKMVTIIRPSEKLLPR